MRGERIWLPIIGGLVIAAIFFLLGVWIGTQRGNSNYESLIAQLERDLAEVEATNSELEKQLEAGQREIEGLQRSLEDLRGSLAGVGVALQGGLGSLTAIEDIIGELETILISLGLLTPEPDPGAGK